MTRTHELRRAAGLGLSDVTMLGHTRKAFQGPRGLPMNRDSISPAARLNHHARPVAARGFTLVEMIVVAGLIIVILAMALPAVSTLWNERKNAAALNTIQGVLMTSRARAMKADGVESGFFAFVDEQGTQCLVTIEQDPEKAGDPAWQSVFVVRDDARRVLPAPMRIVPRYVLADPPGGQPFEVFDDVELANDDFYVPSAGTDQAQRHRNFFAMVFSTDGQLVVNRDVLVQDMDENDDLRGDRTGLPVGPGPPFVPLGKTTFFYARNPTSPLGPTPDIDGPDLVTTTFPDLIVDPADDEIALNFPSVDGLLVYEDSLVRDVPKFEKRAVLIRTAQPLYISRFTGAVIRGPVGEN